MVAQHARDHAVGGHHEVLNQLRGAVAKARLDAGYLAVGEHGLGFAAIQIERAEAMTLCAQLLGGFILQAELRLQILRGGYFGRRRAMPFKPRSDGIVRQLCGVARHSAISLAILDRAIRIHGQFHHHREPVAVLVERRQIR